VSVSFIPLKTIVALPPVLALPPGTTLVVSVE
jgi:hypothetical protein